MLADTLGSVPPMPKECLLSLLTLLHTYHRVKQSLARVRGQYLWPGDGIEYSTVHQIVI